MRTPNCKHFDFAYETYKGENRVYCAVRGANVKRGECVNCKGKKREAAK